MICLGLHHLPPCLPYEFVVLSFVLQGTNRICCCAVASRQVVVSWLHPSKKTRWTEILLPFDIMSKLNADQVTGCTIMISPDIIERVFSKTNALNRKNRKLVERYLDGDKTGNSTNMGCW